MTRKRLIVYLGIAALLLVPLLTCGGSCATTSGSKVLGRGIGGAAQEWILHPDDPRALEGAAVQIGAGAIEDAIKEAMEEDQSWTPPPPPPGYYYQYDPKKNVWMLVPY